MGGLVIIVDLATQVALQRTLAPEEVDAIGAADEIINFVLFSVLGILVVRDSGLIYLGAIAGVFASLLDAVVVADDCFANLGGAYVSADVERRALFFETARVLVERCPIEREFVVV